MIPFNNPKFHEKIMKKYGRMVRKSYFPDLFFKQDIKSSGKGKSRISVRIKFDFHNTIICKNFPLSFPKEKQHKSSFFPLELNIFSSKAYEHIHGFRIRNFLDKNALFLYREYSDGSKSTGMDLSTINEQKIGEFRFSKKEEIQPLSAGKMFSVKKEIAGKETPERFSKKLFTFKKIFLQRDMQGFPKFYSQPVLGLFTLIGSPLSFSKNENLNVAAESHESASTLRDHKSKRYPGYNRSEKIFTTYLTDAFQQYPEANNEIRAGVYGRILISSIKKQTENLQSVLKLNSLCNAEIKSSGHTVTRAFNRLTSFTKNTVTVSQFHPRVSHTLGSTKLLQLNKQETHKPGSTISASYFDVAIKQANRTLIPVFKSLRILLTGNKRTHINETYSTDSSQNIIQENNHHYMHVLLRKAFKLPEVPMSFSTAIIGAGNPAHLQKIPVIRKYNNTATNTPEQLAAQVSGFITARIFMKLVALKPDKIKEYIFNYKAVYSAGVEKAYSHLHFASRALNYAGIYTFSDIQRSLKVPKSTGKVTPLTDYLRADSHLSGPYAADNYVANKQNVDNIREPRELKRRRHYSITGSKLQSTINQPVFQKSPETSTYRPRKSEALLYSSKQSFISNKTAAPIPDLHEAYTFSSQQTPLLYFTSAYAGVHPATGEFNYQATHTQNYPAVPFYYEKFSPLNLFINSLLNPKTQTINYLAINSYIQKKTRNYSAILNIDHLEKRAGLKLSSLLLLFPKTRTSTFFPKKHMLEYLKIIFSPSDSKILSKMQKLIIGGKVSSNILLSDRPFDSFLTSLFETDGTASKKKVIPIFGIPLFNLSKYASVRISQNPVFAGKSRIWLKTELESLYRGRLKHKTTSVSHINEKQKLTGQKVPSMNTERVSLCWRGRKKENSNMRNFLLRSSLNFPEKSSQQVNNMITSAELRKLQSFFSESGFSSRHDFTPKIKWKNLISIFTPGKKQKKRKDMPGRSLFKFKSFRNSDKTAKSHLFLEPKNTYFAFMGTGTGKTYGVGVSGTFGKESSDLLHAMESMHKTGREDFVYGTPQNLLDKVKRIEKIAFEAKEAVVDHFESHLQQENKKTGQVMDIEHISEKVMQIINRRLKIEVERRGIF